MVDRGLLLSGAVIVALLYAAARRAPVADLERGEILDRITVPILAGVLTGRVAAAALDDPASLRSLRAFLVVRGGVEFWPGVVAAAVVLALGLRRGGFDHLLEGLALLAPFLLLAYAGYEGTCVLRDGCYGPASPIGLVPDGLRTRQFPVGLVVAAGVVALAWWLTIWSAPAGAKVLAGVGGVAAVRAVAAIWLPRLGDGLTRAHQESIGVAASVVVAGLVLWLRGRSREGVGPPVVAEVPAAEGNGAATS